jgi:hypothetical protein
MKSVLVRKLSALLLVPLIAGSIACEDSTGPRPLPSGVEIDPVASVFPVQDFNGRKRVTVGAVVRNDSDRTVYYGYCSERIATRTAGVWAPSYPIVCAAIAIPPEPIPPGASKEFSLTLVEQLDGTGFPFTDPNAQYRFEVGLMLRGGSTTSPRFFRIAPEETVSGTFSIK